MNILTFDIGGTHTKWGLVNDQYEILEKGLFDTFLDDSDEKIINLYNRISNFIKEFKLEFDNIAISSAGVIDTETGLVLNDNPTFKNYAGFNIYEYMKKNTGYDVIAINDGNAGALGEMVKGSLQGVKNAVMIVIGTGIGGGIISESKIHSGDSYWAGEIGFSIVNGQQWEEIASTRALVNNVNNELNTSHDGKYIFSNLDNPVIKKHYDNFIKYIAIGIANLFTILGPEKITIGGGISSNESFDVNQIKDAIKPYVVERIFNKINISKATLGNDANLIGAASLLIEKENG